ncbi:MAG TPA: tetratricopeptide repeat protein, partial [Gemmataceae bacterium]|nr:tetratricopeptide repeat protein [Gemmataceae bacterium]
AEQEFAQAWAANPTCFEAGYNLLLTRLSQGRLDEAAAVCPSCDSRGTQPAEQRLLEQIHALLRLARPANGEAHADAALTSMTAAEEQRLVQLVQSIGHLDSADRLLRALQAVRPDSEAVREAAFGVLLARAGELVRRCRWAEARRLLGPRTADPVPRPLLAAGLNLLGICECMMQDFADGRQSFALALRLVESDPYLHQNLALACEWQQHFAQGVKHWQRYFEQLDDRLPIPPGEPDYVNRLACEGLSRLAAGHVERREWAEARDCLERALRASPEDVPVLERLFELHHQARRWAEAREILDQLRQLRPDDPQYEVYALDLMDLKTPDDVERMVTDVDRLRQQHAGEQQVESRLMAVMAHAVEALGELHEELSEQLARARNRLRRLARHEVDWDEVEDFARRLHRRLLKLKVIVDRSVLLAAGEDQKHLRELSQQLTREAAQCRRLVH